MTLANGIWTSSAPNPQLGSPSITLYGLTNLVLHYNWLSLLSDKAARPYEDSGLKTFQILVSGLEFHLDD